MAIAVNYEKTHRFTYFPILTVYENMISCQTCLKNIERNKLIIT